MVIGYAEIISSLALLVSFGSYVLHWRTWRREIDSQRPELLASKVSDEQIEPPWHRIRITLRSRSDEGVAMESLRVKSPKAAALARYLDCAKYGNEGRLRVHLPDRPDRQISTKLRVAHAGSAIIRYAGGIQEMGSGDQHFEDFLILLPEASNSARSSAATRSVALVATLSSLTHPVKRQTRLIKVMIHTATKAPATQ